MLSQRSVFAYLEATPPGAASSSQTEPLLYNIASQYICYRAISVLFVIFISLPVRILPIIVVMLVSESEYRWTDKNGVLAMYVALSTMTIHAHNVFTFTFTRQLFQ